MTDLIDQEKTPNNPDFAEIDAAFTPGEIARRKSLAGVSSASAKILVEPDFSGIHFDPITEKGIDSHHLDLDHTDSELHSALNPETSFGNLDAILSSGQSSPVKDTNQTISVHGFEDIIKPTELLPDSLSKHVDAKAPPTTQEKVEQPVSEKTLTIPDSLISYLDKSNLGVLKYDLDFANTHDDVTRILNHHVAEGKITPDDHKKILELLGEAEESTPAPAPDSYPDIQKLEVPVLTQESESESNEGLSDKELGELAFDNCKVSDFEKAEENVRKIKDKTIRLNILADIVQYLVDVKNFDTAYEFADLIDDPDYRDVVTSMVAKGKKRVSLESLEDEETPPVIEDKKKVEVKSIVEESVVNSVAIEKKVLEGIDLDLEESRLKYAQAKIDYKKKDRENFKWMKDIRAGLGFESTTSDVLNKVVPKNMEGVREALEAALLEYNGVKKKKKEEIFSLSITEEEIKEIDPEGIMSESERSSAVCKVRAVLQAEAEWDKLQIQVDELTPVGPESEAIKKLKKGFALGSKMPPAIRMSVVPLVIGVGVGLTGGLGAGAIYAGTKIVRSAGGLVGSGVASKVFESKVNKKNKSREESNIKKYGEAVSRPEDFENSEIEYMSNREEEQNRKKRQRAAKAVTMVAAGAGAGILAGLAESSLQNLIVSPVSANTALSDIPRGSKPVDGIIHPKASLIPKEGTLSGNIPEKLTATRSILDIKVDVSGKGFIQTFSDMKAKVLEQYGGVDKVPSQIKANILDKSSIELAKEFHLYDPEHNISGVGYKGEHLSLDNQGNVVYEHLDGKAETLFDAEKGKIYEFSRKVDSSALENKPKLSTEPVSSKPVINPETEKLSYQEVVDETPVVPTSDLENIPIKTFPPHVSSALDISPKTHIPYNDSFVDVTNNGTARAIVFKGIEIAHEHPFGSGKILSLDDRFQDGALFKDSREAFAMAFEKNVTTDIVGKTPIGVPFEGGKIYIVHDLESDPASLRVLLNGKEIAKGVLTEKGPKIEINSSLRGGFLRSDTVYERAFKQIRPIIKDLGITPNNLKIAA